MAFCISYIIHNINSFFKKIYMYFINRKDNMLEN